MTVDSSGAAQGESDWTALPIMQSAVTSQAKRRCASPFPMFAWGRCAPASDNVQETTMTTTDDDDFRMPNLGPKHIAQVKRSKRKHRERNCQLVAIGVILANPSLMDELDPADFSAESLGPLYDAICRRKLDPSDGLMADQLARILRDLLGVEVQSGEKTFEAILRTVAENATRERAGKDIAKLALMAENYTCGDADFLKAIARLANKYESPGEGSGVIR